MNAGFDKETNALQVQLEDERKEHREQMEKRVEALRKQLDDDRKEHRDQVDELSKDNRRQVDDLRKQLDDERDAHRNHVGNLRSEHQQEIEKVRKQHYNDMEDLRRQHNEQLQTLSSNTAVLTTQLGVKQASVDEKDKHIRYLERQLKEANARSGSGNVTAENINMSIVATFMSPSK